MKAQRMKKSRFVGYLLIIGGGLMNIGGAGAVATSHKWLYGSSILLIGMVYVLFGLKVIRGESIGGGG